MKKLPKWRLFIILGIFLILCGITTHRIIEIYTKDLSIPTRGGESLSIKIDVPAYTQDDERWADDSLGNTGAPFGSYGCTVCATAMALTARGHTILPNQLNRALSQNNGFTDSGLLIWKGIESITENQFSVRVDDTPSFRQIDNELKQGNPLVAKVWFNNMIWHWVLIVGKENDQYLMHDPLAGGLSHISMDRYKDGIFAVRYLKSN